MFHPARPSDSQRFKNLACLSRYLFGTTDIIFQQKSQAVSLFTPYSRCRFLSSTDLFCHINHAVLQEQPFFVSQEISINLQ